MIINRDNEIPLRFSGHETFTLRVPWISKAVKAIEAGINPFTDPRTGMTELGLGKNMVKALQAWTEYFGVIEHRNDKFELTSFGKEVFGKDGLDVYLEDSRTLWLLHWKASTNPRPYFAWHWFTNICPFNEFSYSEALESFKIESRKSERPLSDVTIKQHLDVFLKTYISSTIEAGVVPEDVLDCPLTSLGFIKKVGGGKSGDNRYVINCGPKESISQELFLYTLLDWLQKYFSNEETLRFFDVIMARNSPSKVFRLSEADICKRLVLLAESHPDTFQITNNANQQALQLLKNPVGKNLGSLKSIYGSKRK